VYYTAINVHNATGRSVILRKKFAVALPLEQPGTVLGFFEAKLGPDEALEIDCQDIFAFLTRPPTPTPPTRPPLPIPRLSFLKGFAIIQVDSASELDVVGVYTASGSTGQVQALEIERVPARRMTLALPDLIPVPDPRRGFCVRDSLGRLLVTVKNQGSGDAPPSTTTVHFATGATVSVSTPPIPAGGSVTVGPVAIPPDCFRPNCDFRIVVDATGGVVESDETNNVAVGQCPG